MTQKLYLHAGLHKTGTTAIQSFAWKNRQALADRGLLYPDYAPLSVEITDGHHDFAHALAEDSKKMTRDEAGQVSRGWLEGAHESGLPLLVSAEALYRHRLGQGPRANARGRYLARVAEELSEFEVEVILVFRRPDDYIRSLYQERVMKQKRSFPDFGEWRDDRQNARALAFARNAGMFREHFPDVTCLLYEDLAQDGALVENFFAELGVDASGLAAPERVRQSLSVPETLTKNFANRFLGNHGESRAFLEWMKSEPVRSEIASAFGEEKRDLWENHEARLRFFESRAEDLEVLRRDFFPSRQEPLFAPPEPAETAHPVGRLPASVRKMVLDKVGPSV